MCVSSEDGNMAIINNHFPATSLTTLTQSLLPRHVTDLRNTLLPEVLVSSSYYRSFFPRPKLTSIPAKGLSSATQLTVFKMNGAQNFALEGQFDLTTSYAHQLCTEVIEAIHANILPDLISLFLCRDILYKLVSSSTRAKMLALCREYGNNHDSAMLQIAEGAKEGVLQRMSDDLAYAELCGVTLYLTVDRDAVCSGVAVEEEGESSWHVERLDRSVQQDSALDDVFDQLNMGS